MKRFIHVLILLALVSCHQNSNDFERSHITVNNQQFEILTAWKIFDDYIINKSDYEKSIFLKIKREFNSDLEFPFLLDAIKSEINPDSELKNEIEIMKSIDFITIVDSAFQVITKELPGPDTKILLIPANPAHRKYYREYGVGLHAFTPGSGKIIVSFDPSFENWQQLLPYTLAHEYHHSVWTSNNFKTANLTPLEYIILEGKADSFAGKIFPYSDHPFINMLDKKNEKRIWNLIKPEMNLRNTTMNDKIFYGTKDIPYGSVYAIGFNIIESFKKNNPGIDDAELIFISPNEILISSKYDEEN